MKSAINFFLILILVSSATAKDPAVTDSLRINLLGRLKQSRDTNPKAWHYDGDSLISPITAASSITIPYEFQDDYILRFLVTPDLKPKENKYRHLYLGLSMHGKRFQVILDHGYGNQRISGISGIDGKNHQVNSTKHIGPVFSANKTSHVECRVSAGKVKVSVDGKQLIDWQGTATSLSESPYFQATDNRLKLASHQRYRINSMTVEPLGQKLDKLSRSYISSVEYYTYELLKRAELESELERYEESTAKYRELEEQRKSLENRIENLKDNNAPTKSVRIIKNILKRVDREIKKTQKEYTTAKADHQKRIRAIQVKYSKITKEEILSGSPNPLSHLSFSINQLRVGWLGPPTNFPFKVQQIINENEMHIVYGNKSHRFLLRGLNTKGMANGQPLRFGGSLFVSGTTAYRTVAGSDNTIFVLDVVDEEKIKGYIKKNVTEEQVQQAILNPEGHHGLLRKLPLRTQDLRTNPNVLE